MYRELNTQLTSEEEAIKSTIHTFAKEVLRPASLALDAFPDPEQVIAPDSVFWDVFRRYYGAGYHLAGLPEHLGGTKLSPLARHIMVEELAWGSADFAVGLGVTSFPFAFAAMSGNGEIIAEIVEPFMRDRDAHYIGCWAITEPQHGSDTLMVGTENFGITATAGDVQASRDGDGWVVNGQKSAWVSNGTIATHALVFLTTDRRFGAAGGGIAVIPLDLPGVTKGPPLDKLGQRALNQGEIFFDDVRIPEEYLLVSQPGYPQVLDSVLANANAFMGAAFTGVARAAFEEALQYSRERVQGGRPICEHQAVQMKLANMFTKVEAARALSRVVMGHNLTISPPPVEFSIASKVFCTQAAFEVASDALQLSGGYGLAKGMLVEKLFRDARAALIEDGTNEVMSLTAAQRLLERYVVDSRQPNTGLGAVGLLKVT
jgi:alkylation response protein AidB-like acyl-CoA dehydrogenase